MAGERWSCAQRPSPQGVHPSGLAASPLLQMGCLGSARWAPCRTDPTSRSPLLCSSACRMSCGISWHKVKGGARGESLRPGGEGVSGVLLAQGPGWAEEGFQLILGGAGPNLGHGTQGQDTKVASHELTPRFPGLLRVSQPPPVAGLSWQDGITQYVISQEMERIPRLRPPPSLESAARDR